MTARLERPHRARAALRSMIYRLTTRARQTPAYHPLRLQLEEELADLKAELAEVEQYIAALSLPKLSKLAAAPEAVPIRDLPRATRPASAAHGDALHARGEEICSGWMDSGKHERGDPDQIPSTASIAAQYRPAADRSLHRADVLAAHGAPDSPGSVWRMLETIGESVIEFWVIVFRAPGRFTRHARRTFSHCGSVATRNWRRAVILTQQGMAGSSRLLQQSAEASVASGKEFRAFVSRILSRSSDRFGALLGSCLVLAANLRRLAGAVMRQCMTASVSFLHRSRQMTVATLTKLWRSARQTLIRTSDRISAGLGQCRVATGQGARRAYAAARQGFAASRRLLVQKVAQPGSRWAESFRRLVVLCIADGAGAATGVGRRAAEGAGVEARRSIAAGRLLLQKVAAAVHIRGGEMSVFSRRLWLQISDRARKALAISRPVAIQAWRNARSAALRSAARCQQITVESMKTAHAKWTEMSPKLQRSGADAPDRGGEISAVCWRLSLRISDRARKALAVSRPSAIRALRYARAATLRGAAQCQQIVLESLKTARSKWTELSHHAALAGAAVGRQVAPKLQQARVQAKRDIATGKLFLEKVMVAAHIKAREMSIFCRRLQLRISDSVRKSVRRLPPPGDQGLAAQAAEPTAEAV